MAGKPVEGAVVLAEAVQEQEVSEMKTHKLTGLRPPKQVPESLEVLQEQIRVRAYQLYEERGRGDGHEVDDWLQAESEVAQKSNTAAA